MIEVWVGFGVLILGTIFGVLSYFFKRLIEGFEKKIDNIDSKIEFLVVKSTTADNEIIELKNDIMDIYQITEKTNDKIEDLHTRLTVVETQHNRNHK